MEVIGKGRKEAFRKRVSGRVRKWVALVMLLGAVGSLSGCAVDQIDWEMISNNTDNAEQAFYNLRDRNIKQIRALKDAGFLSEEQAKEWEDGIKSKVKGMLNTLKHDKDADKTITKAVTNAITHETAVQLGDFFTTNAWYWHKDGNFYAEPEDSNVGNCSAHGGSAVVAGRFYKIIECPHVDVGPPRKECHEDAYEEFKPSKFRLIAKGVGVKYDENNPDDNGHIDADTSKVIEGKGKAFELYDRGQVEELKNALSRPVRVINNFDGADKSTEMLQLTLAILQGNRTGAEEIMREYNLQDKMITGGISEEDRDSGNGNNNSRSEARSLKVSELVPNVGNLDKKDIKTLEEYLIKYTTYVKDENGAKVPFIEVETYNRGKRTSESGAPCIFADTVYDDGRHIGNDTGNDSCANVLGKDLAISADGKVALLIRIMELNPDLIDLLGNKEDLNGEVSVKGKYYVTDMYSDPAAIKLDYPLYKVQSIRANSVDSTDWRCTIAPTTLFMDLSDGAFYDSNHYRIKSMDNFYNNRSIAFWNSQYIDPRDPESGTATDVVGAKQVEVKVRPLVLKDYVELYHIEDKNGVGLNGKSDPKELWTPIGRRMRIKKFSGNRDDILEFAQSLNTDGSLPSEPNFISLDEVADRTSGYGYYKGTAEVLGLGNSNPANVQEKLTGSGTRGDTFLEDASTGLVDSSGSAFEFSATAYWDFIEPTMYLGMKEEDRDDGEIKNPALAVVDENKVNVPTAGGTYLCPTIYGMCIASSIQEENLTGGDWIGSSRADCKKIEEWNTWLRNNRFTYQVDIDKLLDMLGVYIEMLEDGENAITFDPVVIEHINTGLEEKHEDSLLRNIRTIFRLFGFLITSYALILLGAWTYDVNIFAGPRLLTILSGGHWIAVRDREDMGYTTGEMNENEQSYIDARELIMRICIIMAVGILLMVIDIFDIKDMILKYTSGIIEVLGDFLRNG